MKGSKVYLVPATGKFAIKRISPDKVWVGKGKKMKQRASTKTEWFVFRTRKQLPNYNIFSSSEKDWTTEPFYEQNWTDKKTATKWLERMSAR